MAESSGQEKTEDPTPKRLDEARGEGNVARSPDLAAALMLLAAILLLWGLGTRVLGGMKMSLITYLSGSHTDNLTRAGDIGGMAVYGARMIGSALAPLILCVAAVGLLANVAQVGLMLTGKALAPKASRVSPLQGTKNLFGARSAVKFLMSVAKLACIAGLAAWVIYQQLDELIHIGELEVAPAFLASAQLVFWLGIKLAALLLILAVLDYLYQRWQHQQDLKMTKQEVKEETKSMEGDPQVRQRRAKVGRELAMQRTAAAVPEADVVVTNPTHFAVALRYDSSTMAAPSVHAKGADLMAMRIRQIAASHDVPIVERKPLARALYDGVEVGEQIPPDQYAAVAEILAYVYRLSDAGQSEAAA